MSDYLFQDFLRGFQQLFDILFSDFTIAECRADFNFRINPHHDAQIRRLVDLIAFWANDAVVRR